MARSTGEDYTALLAKIKNDFDQRLMQLATQPEQWVDFIDQVADFGAQYSLANQILLAVQAEERGITPQYFLPYGNKNATSGWKAHHRHVRPGETGFKIWAPIRRRPTEEQAQQWAAAGRTVRRDSNGRPTIQIVGFRLTTTFDLHQTEGEPFTVPTLRHQRRLHAAGEGPQLLTGDDPTHVYDDVVALITAEGYTFELAPPGSPHLRAANGVTVTSDALRVVKVRNDVDPAQRLKTTLHELAHIRCRHTQEQRSGRTMHRGRAETEAESIAHIVCRALGLDSSTYSDDYVFGWADGDMDLVRQCAETVLRVAKQIMLDLSTADADPVEMLERDCQTNKSVQLRVFTATRRPL